MNIDNIQNLLPNPNGKDYDELKEKHPYNILLIFAEAIENKYPNKISGIITQTSTSANIINYAFYISADIGSGYSYRLLEINPTSAETYPLEINIFENFPRTFATASNAEQFEAALKNIFSLTFTHNLILNLLAQIDLYKESREEN